MKKIINIKDYKDPLPFPLTKNMIDYVVIENVGRKKTITYVMGNK